MEEANERGLERTSPEIPPQVPASSEDTSFTRLRGAYEISLLRGRKFSMTFFNRSSPQIESNTPSTPAIPAVSTLSAKN